MTQATKSTCESPDRVRGAFMRHLIKPFSVGLLIIIGLAGCSQSESVSNRDAPPKPRSTVAVAQNVEATYFQKTVYDNIFRAHQCKQCHISGSGRVAFADENVNTAFSAAKTIFDPTSGDPSSNTFVDRVTSGHFNWSSDAPADAQEVVNQLQAWKDALVNGGDVANNTDPATTPKDILKAPQLISPTAPITIDPNDPNTLNDPNYFQAVYNIVTDKNQGYCQRCHSSNTTENTPQRPFFAQTGGADANADMQVALNAVISAGLVNLTNPAKSKLVVRPWPQQHTCGSDCQGLSNTILAAITKWSGLVQQGNPQFDSSLLPSKALTMADGQVTSGGARFDDYVVAKYEFTEGSDDITTNDTVAHDTSGVDPVIDLRLFGNVGWVGGYGIQIGPGGQARSISVSQSQKLHDLIVSRGEYSIEAWVIPDNTAEQGSNMDSAVIASYSSGTSSRNFTLGQYMTQYTFHNRVGVTTSNQTILQSGENAVQTTLQHVVMTYSQADGRKIYVNGVPVMCDTQVTVSGDYPDTCETVNPDVTASDIQPLTSWDPGYLLTVGSDTDGKNQWLGKIKFLAIHSKALTEREVRINLDASVGQRFNLLFNISSIAADHPSEWTQTIGANSYIWFQVAVYDDYSYLFSEPTYIDLDYNKGATIRPAVNFSFRGMRIGINGKEASVGQAYVKLGKSDNPDDATNNPNDLTSGLFITSPDPVSLTRLQGQQFNNITPASGTVIPKDIDDKTDQFFLTFERIGGMKEGKTRAVTAPTFTPTYTGTGDKSFVPGVRTFDEINATMSAVTGISTATVFDDDSNGLPGFKTLRAQLPDNESVDTFSAAQQTAIASLAGRYCHERVVASDASAYFSVSAGFFGQSVSAAFPGGSSGTNMTAIINALTGKMVRSVGTFVDPTNYLNGSALDPANAPPDSNAAGVFINGQLHSLAAYLLDETPTVHICQGVVNNAPQDCTGPARTKAIVTALCTAVLSSAVVTQQ